MYNSTPRISRDIAYLCAQHGIQQVIVTPGSRNAPLVMAFQEEPSIACLSIIDERSAAFFALGMIQAYQQPVAICCTSGTALLNFYPAVAEAFYQELPLLVLSADRPLEKIDQQIGQSIRQSHVLTSHVKKSIQLVEEVGDSGLRSYNHRQVNEALVQLRTDAPGPVHINIPLREPLYDQQDLSSFSLPKVIRLAETYPRLIVSSWEAITNTWKEAGKILILAGMREPDSRLDRLLGELASSKKVVVLADWVSGLSHPSINCQIDQTLSQIPSTERADFVPDLLITFGNGIVSKRIKQILLQVPVAKHWHINTGAKVIDTFESLTQIIPLSPTDFFERIASIDSAPSEAYALRWTHTRSRSQKLHQEFLSKAPYSDLSVFDRILTYLPKSWDIHIANSSVIRYMQLFPRTTTQGICWGNRGTSGIDGSTSTAIGYAFASKRPTVLISGDISFFYDSNGWWNTYVPPHFRAILINNQGGGIFRLIDGPSQGGILDPYQETPHELSAEFLARTYGVSYDRAENEVQVETCLRSFFDEAESSRILEIITPRHQNAEVWRNYQTFLSSPDS